VSRSKHSLLEHTVYIDFLTGGGKSEVT